MSQNRDKQRLRYQKKVLFTNPSLSPQTARPDVQEGIFMLQNQCVAPGQLLWHRDGCQA